MARAAAPDLVIDIPEAGERPFYPRTEFIKLHRGAAVGDEVRLYCAFYGDGGWDRFRIERIFEQGVIFGYEAESGKPYISNHTYVELVNMRTGEIVLRIRQ